MTTDQLIAVLAADLTPVNPRRIEQALIVALVAGAIMAFGAMLLVFGLRPENLTDPYLNFVLAKLLITSSIVASAAVLLPRLARPGEPVASFIAVVSVPFAVAALFTVATVLPEHWPAWPSMAVGKTWLTCLFFIPLLATGPFLAVVWALRTGAPTDMATAGSAAGLVAGGLGAMACSLPCLDNSLPAIAASYGTAIAACAALGATFGSRLLRW